MRKIGVVIWVLLLFSALFISTFPAGDSMEPGNGPSFSFDRDGNNIDDDLDADVDFPVWGLVRTDSDVEVSEGMSSAGCIPGNTLKNIPVTIALFPDREALLEVSRLPFVDVIESDGEVVFAMDTSVGTVKVEPSAEYSPDTVRDLGYQGEGMTVAVLDLGIDNDHPALEGSFAAGVDFTVPESPLTPRDGSYDPDDKVGHGTGVACVLASRGDEDGTKKGIVPEAGVIDLKMSDYNPAYIRAMAEAMDWCLENKDTEWGNGYEGIDVISMSALTGLDPDGTLAELIDLIAEEGIPFVQAAGNDGVRHGEDPATYFWSDNVITAGGLDDRGTVDRSDDIHWSGATYGPRTDDGDDDPYDELRPDVVAPAVNLTVAAHSSDVNPPSGWTVVEGTSYATPHVSGVVALILQANPEIADLDGPEVLETIRQILHESAEARGALYDPSLSLKYSTRYGFGILDGNRAVLKALDLREGNSAPVIASMDSDPGVLGPGMISQITVDASDPDGDSLRYAIEVSGGQVEGYGPSWTWTAPSINGYYDITVTVSDVFGNSDQDSISIEVVKEDPGNRPPVITSFTSTAPSVMVEERVELVVLASDPDGDRIDYDYTVTEGRIRGIGDEVEFEASDEPGMVTVEVVVSDGNGGEDTASLDIIVIPVPEPDPPEWISLTMSPGSVAENDPGLKVTIEARVLQGTDPIEGVYADLTQLGKGSRTPFNYQWTERVDGIDQMEYTLEVRGLHGLDPGTYTILVHSEDEYGMSSKVRELTLTVNNVQEQEADDVDDGGSGFPAWAVVVVIVIVVFALLVSLIIRKIGS